MSSFDPSPRAAKRRKTTTAASDDDAGLPLHSRVLKSFKQAVYGKPASPKRDDVFAPQQGRVTPRRKNLAKKEEPEPPLDDHLHSGDERNLVDELNGNGEGQGNTVRSGSRQKANGMGRNPGVHAETYETLRTPTKTKGRRRKYKSHASNDGGQEGINVGVGSKDHAPSTGDGSREEASGTTNGDISRLDEGALNVSTKKQRRKKHKGWVYLDEQDAPARNSSEAEGGHVHVNGNWLDGSITAGRTPRKGTAEEVEVPREGDAPSPTSQRKIDRLRKQLEIDMEPDVVLPVQLNHEKSPMEDDSQRQDSTDELAQDDHEIQSEQDQTMHTPSESSRKRPRKPDIFEFQKSPSAEAITNGALQQPLRTESQGITGDHAKVLQKLLDDPYALITLQTQILNGLTGKRRLPLVDLEEEHKKVHQLVEQTVLAGEGNSMLIIGSRGSGKTTLVEIVISQLDLEHQDHFHVVRLNGFIHTDDKLALREIWRQLGKEMDVENDDLSGRSNYADTLTSLLALLAHPVGEENGDEAATATSVVFVLDEFDLFASHPRQTLLYNLFDVAQSHNAPIAVLGLTSKVNVVDSLEKRVKSRFGQRYVHLSLPKTFTAFQDICLSALSYHPTPYDLLQTNKTDLQGLATAWNNYIATLFETAPFQNFLQTLYTSTKSISTFLSASLLPISLMTATSLPTTSSFTSNSLLPPDSKLTLLPSLSTLELSLLIAAARLGVILSTDICTFGMVYEEYVALASKSKMQSSAAGQMAVGGGARVWSKEIAKGAWERLAKLELVLPATGGGRGGKGEMWRVDVGLEEIGGCLEGMSGIGLGGLGKWCREI